YAVFPGGFKPEKRELSRKYVPAMKTLGSAGWQPVPYAVADKAGVDIERYGSGDTLHLAVHSLVKGGPSGALTVAIEAPALWAEGATALRAQDLVTGESVVVTVAAGRWTFP